MTTQPEQSQQKTLDSEKFIESFRAKKNPPKKYKRNLSPEFIEGCRHLSSGEVPRSSLGPASERGVTRSIMASC